MALNTPAPRAATFTVRLTADQRAELSKIAAIDRRPVSETIRIAIDALIDSRRSQRAGVKP